MALHCLMVQRMGVGPPRKEHIYFFANFFLKEGPYPRQEKKQVPAPHRRDMK